VIFGKGWCVLLRGSIRVVENSTSLCSIIIRRRKLEKDVSPFVIDVKGRESSCEKQRERKRVRCIKGRE